FKEHLRFTRDFNCSIVGTETGSVMADYSFHPGNHSEGAFQSLTASVAELVAEAEKFGAIVCIEAVAKHVIHTPQRMRRILDTIGSNNLQVIFDPVNLLTVENYQDQDRIIQESFELFGDRMLVLHAKDFIVEDDRIKTVPAGQGLLNYSLLLGLLKQTKPYIYTLLEDTKPEFLDTSRAHLINLIESI
ncbi:MAG TPA: TIM barrel protein, partial [Bacillota bacterium]|nr:TIM barrel protein [Bacillota bacterium]